MGIQRPIPIHVCTEQLNLFEGTISYNGFTHKLHIGLIYNAIRVDIAQKRHAHAVLFGAVHTM